MRALGAVTSAVVTTVLTVAAAGCGTESGHDAAVLARAEPGPAPVDESVPRPPTATAPESSTSTTTSTTTTAPPVSAASTWTLSGEHRGVEHFTIGTGRCAFLDHQLDGSFTLADGAILTFRSEYCGTVDASSYWTGTGTFELVAGDGSSLTGTSTSAAQLPSTGEPYHLDVSAGTGQYAGATGRCDLDNHLRTISPGVQEQWGTFTCDLGA